jgi:hypothetical protein
MCRECHGWASEPFLREGEDPAVALGEGTARRRALDDAVAEMDAGLTAPSSKCAAQAERAEWFESARVWERASRRAEPGIVRVPIELSEEEGRD